MPSSSSETPCRQTAVGPTLYPEFPLIALFRFAEPLLNDVSVAELRTFMSKGKRSGTGKKVKPKYKDPASGAKWSGRGSAPLWIVAGEKAGKKRESFLIR